MDLYVSIKKVQDQCLLTQKIKHTWKEGERSRSLSVFVGLSSYLLFQKMDQLIIDSAVIVPLYYDYIVRLINPQINGFENNPMNLIHLKRTKK